MWVWVCVCVFMWVWGCVCVCGCVCVWKRDWTKPRLLSSTTIRLYNHQYHRLIFPVPHSLSTAERPSVELASNVMLFCLTNRRISGILCPFVRRVTLYPFQNPYILSGLLYLNFSTIYKHEAEPNLSAVGLRPLACWDCGFESLQGNGCLSLLSVVCCQVEDCMTGWSLTQRSPKKCDVYECYRKVKKTMLHWPTRGCRAIKKCM